MKLSSSWEHIISFYEKLNKPDYIKECIKLFARIFDNPERITEMFGLYFTSEEYYNAKWKYHYQFLNSFSDDDFLYWSKKLDNASEEIRRNSSYEFEVFQKLELSEFDYKNIEENHHLTTPDFQVQLHNNPINIEVSSITDRRDVEKMNKFDKLVREIWQWARKELEGEPSLNIAGIISKPPSDSDLTYIEEEYKNVIATHLEELIRGDLIEIKISGILVTWISENQFRSNFDNDRVSMWVYDYREPRSLEDRIVAKIENKYSKGQLTYDQKPGILVIYTLGTLDQFEELCKKKFDRITNKLSSYSEVLGVVLLVPSIFGRYTKRIKPSSCEGNKIFAQNHNPQSQSVLIWKNYQDDNLESLMNIFSK